MYENQFVYVCVQNNLAIDENLTIIFIKIDIDRYIYFTELW